MKTTLIDSIIWLLIVAFLSFIVWGTLEFTSWIRMSGYETYVGAGVLVIIVVGMSIKLYEAYQA